MTQLITNEILVNRIKTPDGTILTSRHRHDYQSHVDKITGETYVVDGGTDYLRRSTNIIEAEDISLSTDSPFEEIREGFTWGTHGKDGKQPLTQVLLKDMSNNHIIAVLESQPIKGKVRELFFNELRYRANHKIIVDER